MSNRRLLWVVSAVVFADTLFYSVIAPLLPHLTHELHMSKLAAGVMTAGYPAGMLTASLPGGLLAMRAGPRFTLCVGLAMMAISTFAFGLLHTAITLDLARFIEGIGGACSWAGGVTWLMAATPVQQRGAVMGQSMGASIAGGLFGPAVGAIASATGRPAMFCALGVVAIALIGVTRTLPERRQGVVSQRLDALLPLLRRPEFMSSMWLMALPAIISGTMNVLVPLRMHALGAGAGLIGVTFLVGAGVEAAVSPLVGRLSDRFGRLAPMRVGLGAIAVALACFMVPRAEAVFAVTIVCTLLLLGVFWAPVMALVSDLAEQSGVHQALAAALMNLSWAGGQIIGSAGGGAIAKSFGDLVPTATSAGLCALTLFSLSRPRRRQLQKVG